MAMQRRAGSGSLLGDLMGFDPFRGTPSSGEYGFEIARTENGYQLELPVAGFKPEEISITLEDRELTIEGKSERRRFTRALLLPEEIDPENITANVEHGLLTIAMQLHPRMRPRKIDVQIGRGVGPQDSLGRQSASGESTAGAASGGSTVPADSGAGGP